VRPLVGDVARAVLDIQAEEERPALQSFGSKVLGRAGRVTVGELLDQVLGESRGPILITPEPHPASKVQVLEGEAARDPERPAVLVATDGSEVSLQAAEYAARLAGSLGAKLFALYTVEDFGAHSAVLYAEVVEQLSQEGREATGKARAMAEKAGVECEELIILGRPERAIIAVAEELGADPIVLGARGKSRLEHAWIGSVSQSVLRQANRTVLVVGGHPEDEGSEVK
jgi:nucleotide-binding universal stress UspA family protein